MVILPYLTLLKKLRKLIFKQFIMKKLFMKLKFLFIGLLLISNNLFAQELLQPTDEKTHIEYMDKVLEPLIQNDVNLFKNGILYDRVFPMAKLDNFNNPDSLNTSSFTHFTRSLSELYDASINSQTDVLSLQNISDIAYHFEREGKIQIGIINMDFTIIDSTALDTSNAKIEIVNQKLQRIANTDSPYIHKNALVIAPIAQEMIRGENITFEFGKIIIQKSDKQIKDLIVIFENNQSFNIFENSSLINESITVNFQESGNKEMAIDVTFLDNTSQTTFAVFNIQTTPSNNEGIIKITATDPFHGYDEPSDCNGTCYGEGEYKIYYNPSGNNKIMKPIIITDGFDPNNARKLDGLVNGQPYQTPSGFTSELHPPNPETLYNMMYYHQDDNHNFIDDLHAQGFDVILLSFPKYFLRWETIFSIPVRKYRDGGSDYFERDAQVVKSLIRKINTELNTNGSDESITLVGPSGGAILSRIALVEMEQNGEDHNVDLFVSFDGPHLGANVPIGLQKGAVYFGLSYLDDFGLNPLNNPWSKQSILNHYLSNSTYPAGAPNFRDFFQNKMDNLGFPQQCRNIAFNNGSAGIANATAGANMFSMYFTYYFFGTKKRELWINFDGNSGSKNVFRWKKSHKHWFSGNWITDKDVKKHSNTHSNYGSLDTCPGSYLDLIYRTYKNTHADFPMYYYDGNTNYPFGDYYWAPIVLSWFTNFDIYLDLKEDAIFMPSKSTLAYTGSNPSWHENLGCRNLVCTGETPFDSYYTPPENQAHVSVHPESVEWFLDELQGIIREPVYSGCAASSSTEITGSDNICYNETKTYQINNNCIGNITWSASNNLLMSSPSDSDVQVTSINENTGYAWVKATLDNGDYIEKKLVGKPVFILQVNYSDDIFPKICISNSSIDIDLQGITEVEWLQNSGESGGIYEVDSDYCRTVAGGPNNTVTGTVTLTNDCGSTTHNFSVTIPEHHQCTNLIIETIGQNKYRVTDPCNLDEILYVDQSELYNQYGVKIQDITPQQDEINIEDTSDSGTIRIIKVISEGKIGTKRVIID